MFCPLRARDALDDVTDVPLSRYEHKADEGDCIIKNDNLMSLEKKKIVCFECLSLRKAMLF